jgi:hypothetical protein
VLSDLERGLAVVAKDQEIRHGEERVQCCSDMIRASIKESALSAIDLETLDVGSDVFYSPLVIEYRRLCREHGEQAGLCRKLREIVFLDSLSSEDFERFIALISRGKEWDSPFIESERSLVDYLRGDLNFTLTFGHRV